MPARKTKKQIKAATTTGVLAIALALLLWAGLDLFLRVQFHQEWKNDSSLVEPVATKTPKEKNPKNTRLVASQHIFGQQQQASKAIVATQAPATRLNLKLIGVIAGEKDSVSKVIIQIDNAEIGVFSVGDKLPRGNARIERIEATQVLLERNGKLESLAIIRPELEQKER